MSRARWTSLLALAGLVACEQGSVEPAGETALALQIWSEPGLASLADAGRVHIEGPTNRTVSIAPGETRTIEGLNPGSYTVTLEAFLGGEVESMGQTGVTVVAGQTATASIALQSFVPRNVSAPPQALSGQAINVQFQGVTGATNYRVEWDDNPAFSSPQSTDVSGPPASITIAEAGTFHVRVRARNRFGSTSLPATASQVQVTPPVTPLQNGTPLPDRSGGAGSQTFYTFDVPSGPLNRVLQVKVLGGNGNADLAVRFGDEPTLDTFDCASVNDEDHYGKIDFCSVLNPDAGTWHVMLFGQESYDGVTIEARMLQREAMSAGTPITGISGDVGDIRYFRFDVPGGAPAASPSTARRIWSGSELLGVSSPVARLPARGTASPRILPPTAAPQGVPGTLRIEMSGGTGDADLAAVPGIGTYSFSMLGLLPCFPFVEGNEEVCDLSDPPSGSWTVMVLGYTPFSGVSLQAAFEPAGHTLTVTGSGSGTVAGGPIDCTIVAGAASGTCTAVVPTGSQVSLTATPAQGFQFGSWQEACSGTGGCTVTMDGDRTVRANFVQQPVPPVISNPVSTIIEINSANCSNGGTLRTITFEYSDADGDIGATVDIRNDYSFQPSGDGGTVVQTAARNGDGHQGTLTAGYCTTWGNSTQVTDVLTIRDAFGNTSNPITVIVPKPHGANTPGAAPAQVRGPGGEGS